MSKGRKVVSKGGVFGWQAGMLLLVHGEVTSPEVDVFDREMVFIETVLRPLLEQLPNLKVVLEHITTQQAVEFVESAPANIAASITPQHMLFNRNALFQVGTSLCSKICSAMRLIDGLVACCTHANVGMKI